MDLFVFKLLNLFTDFCTICVKLYVSFKIWVRDPNSLNKVIYHNEHVSVLNSLKWYVIDNKKFILSIVYTNYMYS